jgi:hypothetical protein
MPEPFTERCITARRDPDVFLADYKLGMDAMGRDPVREFQMYLRDSLRKPWWEKFQGDYLTRLQRNPTWEEVCTGFRRAVGSHLFDKPREARLKLVGKDRIIMGDDLREYCINFRLAVMDAGPDTFGAQALADIFLMGLPKTYLIGWAGTEMGTTGLHGKRLSKQPLLLSGL